MTAGMTSAVRPDAVGSDAERSPGAGRARRVVARAPGGGLGPAPLWPLVCVQVAGALTLGAWAAGSGLLLLAVTVPAVLLVCVAVARRWGQPLPAWFVSWLALRRRQRQAQGPLAAGLDPLLALATECLPDMRCHSFARPDRRDVGMVEADGRITAVVRVEAALSPLQPGHETRPLPLPLLYDALDTDGIRLDSVQCVQHTQPAPVPQLPKRSVAGVSYALLQAQGRAPALRLTWIALSLDPEWCPRAVAERGGGLAGAQRALTRAADQLTSRLTGAGFRASVLSEAELLSAVAACAGSDPTTTTLIGRGDGERPRRTAESSRVWRCDDRWHATFRVARWPVLGSGATPLSGLVALLTSLPAFATTFALTLRREGRRTVAVSGHIRVTGRGDGELRTASRHTIRTARGARVSLTRMDREQLPGLLATLPLGGVR